MEKKKIIMIILLIICVISIIFVMKSVNAKASDKIKEISETKVDIEITDNYFIQATTDIYLNVNDYIGKTIKMEGFMYYYEDTEGKIRHAVIRNTPGCCGTDGLAGLDIEYNKAYPLSDTWVQVVGVIKKDNISGDDTAVINVTDIVEKEEGTSFVTN